MDIPQGKLVVITGVSGSGKSSLAFDTLYAEGQRRYVESLSSYARQFLGRMQKPDVERIENIPPAIAIQQRVSSHNPRSTVGTVTEIYDYLKLFFARIGHTYSPVTHSEVKRHTIQDVVATLEAQPKGSRCFLLTPAMPYQERWAREGFSRLMVSTTDSQEAQVVRIDDYTDEGQDVQLMVDRIVADGERSTSNRFADSVQTAFFEGEGNCELQVQQPNGQTQTYTFSTRFEADGMQFMEPSEHLFDFNSPLGACPHCSGYGNLLGIDPDLVVPDKTLSIYDGAIACWRGEKMSQWNDALCYSAEHFGLPIHIPYYQLTEEQKQLIWTGNEYFTGLEGFFHELETKQYAKIQYRVMLARYKGKTTCPYCHGTRLRPEAGYVEVGGKNIMDLCRMPIERLSEWFRQLHLSESETQTAKQLLYEIQTRLQFLEDVGLSYLTLSRMSNTLSGGESQRIQLAKSLGSSLVGSLYVLDEPSIGLHARDTERLIKVLKQLRDLGNTIVVVEHDEDIIAAADYIIEIGPAAGRHGGEVVYAGPAHKGHTVFELPPYRRPWNNYIEVTGACENNLKGLDVRFPLGVMTAIAGVSGSGKSTLVSKVFYPAMKKYYGGMAERTGQMGQLRGALHLVRNIEFVDQNPLSKSSRSNPVTYLKAYDEIRKLYGEQQLSKQMGYTASHFSFNTSGGRCEQCEGEGTITIEMQFMADLTIPCEQCHGQRFKQDVLDVKYRGQSIYDILCMTVNQAIEFFGTSDSNTTESREEENMRRKIVQRLKPLQDVGIGYVQLGQSSSTLSGGESQRVKLASFLAQEKAEPTIFVFDEPTTGLSSKDIVVLLKALNALIEKGHTVVVIEHNPQILLAADHVIELGPEGGEKGGQIVFEGTPEEMMECPGSLTGQYLRSR